jgi:ABC-type spermidine/putrescine transport system permease subunit I
MISGRSVKKRLAKEWLTLIAGLMVGFLVVPTFFYIFISPADYTSSHSLIDAYKEVIKERGEAIVIGFGPYLLYQFARSVFWAIKALKEK